MIIIIPRRCVQTNNFFGKALMWATFAGVAFIRSTKDLDQYKELLKEARARAAGVGAARVLGERCALCVHLRLTCAWRALSVRSAGDLLRQAVVRHVGRRAAPVGEGEVEGAAARGRPWGALSPVWFLYGAPPQAHACGARL
jgi:hypothetical protein